ncbi:hypothetical protein VNO77_15981 [Canavalia gladiata]|uniref:Cucumisin n=1 Tax=Canavalia gladiata TaxID=3824 RepID=A0AAN9QRP3_CANGL
MSNAMKISKNLPLLILLCLYCLPLLTQGLNQNERKPYIVYMGKLPVATTYAQKDHHHNLLATVIGDHQLARESQIHSYGKSFNGFVARLLPHEAEKLLEDDNVVSVFPNKLNKLHTTRSWDFLGLTENVKRQPTEESNLIVGVLDSGIWIDCPSFNDKGYGPPPSTWKGKCGAGKSPVDEEGHGTHTASTAAGVAVKGGSVYGIGEGTVRGGVEGGRIAMYKVCWPDRGCSDADVLAGFDEAIADGVNILSVSLGGSPKQFFTDPIAIGSFHAMKKGILTSCSAGNTGPSIHTVQNVAPWILTVAASSIDRKFITEVQLGDGKITSGRSINTFSPEEKLYPLFSGAVPSDPSSCDYDSLTNETVSGRIVYCPDNANNDFFIKQLGGAGSIVGLADEIDYSTPTIIPGVSVDADTAGKTILSYVNSTKNPKAVIRQTTSTTVPAPFVASFSSRGPQSITSNILKPDITAPGLDILAGFSKLTTLTATPLKTNDDTAELGYGSGQINPVGALDPGLVYNMSTNSYIAFLCKEGYNSTNIGAIIGTKGFDCSSIASPEGTDGINYPSMHIQIPSSNSTISAIFHRNVTNVGFSNSTYKAKVTTPKGLSIEVIPDTLKFSGLNQELSFKVVLKGSQIPTKNKILSASLEWNDSKYSVRSPIVVYKQ